MLLVTPQPMLLVTPQPMLLVTPQPASSLDSRCGRSARKSSTNSEYLEIVYLLQIRAHSHFEPK
jgi:hypothetical protein